MDIDKHVRPFAEWLAEQRQGAAQAEVSAAFNDLISAVQQHGKGGKLTLTVNVKPAGSDRNIVFVSDKVAVTLPEGERPTATFFIDENDNLTRRDPRQPELPLRAIDGGAEQDDEAKGAGA